MVHLADQNGKPEALASISLSITGGGTLNGKTTVTTDANGNATFSGLSVNQAGSFTLTASVQGTSSPSIAAVKSQSFTVTVGDATIVNFVSQPPATVLVGSPFSVQAQLLDKFGNGVSNAVVNLTISAGTLKGQASLTTDANGLANFTGLSDLTVGKQLSLTVKAGKLSSTSLPFNLVATTATSLAFTTQPPATVVAGSTFKVVAQVTDAFGNALSVANVPVTLTVSSGKLRGVLTVKTNAAGQAIFTNVSDTVANAKATLTASAADLTNIVSKSFAVTAATAAELTFANQPRATQAGSILKPIIVKVTDKFGNPVAGVAVTLKASSGKLAGTVTVKTNAAGEAIFNDLSDTVANAKVTLTASAANLKSIVSEPFAITAAAAAKLAFVTQPTATKAGSVLKPVAVKVTDKFGNPVAGIAVTLTASSGKLNGTVTVKTNAAGEAIFNNLSDSTVDGELHLTASAAGLASILSNPFNIHK